ncbi:MAG TPA: response regulator, partial [Acidobacteriota bacterium]|nr:response regulator [Acidobacteriota bacterium]
DLIVYLFNSFGYSTLTARNGREGLEKIRSNLPDLVVCDVELPVLDGCSLAREIKADPALRPIPLVAVTAHAMIGDRERVLAAGFDGYISKPIEPQTFVREVETFLRSGPSAPASIPSQLPEARPVCQKSIRILVVDDTSLNLILQRSLFEPLGYEVITATATAQALALARQCRPDLIISDLNISEESGFKLIQAVRSDPMLRDVPFLFVTSTTRSEAARARGLAQGAQRFLFRPIEPQVLLAEVESCLRVAGG